MAIFGIDFLRSTTQFHHKICCLHFIKRLVEFILAYIVGIRLLWVEKVATFGVCEWSAREVAFSYHMIRLTSHNDGESLTPFYQVFYWNFVNFVEMLFFDMLINFLIFNLKHFLFYFFTWWYEYESYYCFWYFNIYFFVWYRFQTNLNGLMVAL